MPGTFNCPSCGAPLDYPGSGDTIRCPYCNNSVIVPEVLRPKTPARPAPAPSLVEGLNAGQLAEIRQLMRAGQEIQAIKLYRQVTLKGLKEAKYAVEAIAAADDLPLADPEYQGHPTAAGSSSAADQSSGGRAKFRIGAVLVGLFFLGIASIFPLVFFPMGIEAWQAHEYAGAIGSFFGAVVWAVVWGGIGVIIAFAKT